MRRTPLRSEARFSWAGTKQPACLNACGQKSCGHSDFRCLRPGMTSADVGGTRQSVASRETETDRDDRESRDREAGEDHGGAADAGRVRARVAAYRSARDAEHGVQVPADSMERSRRRTRTGTIPIRRRTRLSHITFSHQHCWGYHRSAVTAEDRKEVGRAVRGGRRERAPVVPDSLASGLWAGERHVTP